MAKAYKMRRIGQTKLSHYQQVPLHNETLALSNCLIWGVHDGEGL